LLGYPEKALASIADALALAERIAHPFTLGLALSISSLVYLNRREPDRALHQVEAAEVLAAEQRLSLIYETGILRGSALLGQGAVDEAIARIREGVTRWTRLGRTLLLPYSLAFLAEGLARHGDSAAALAALREGLDTADATGEHMWDAELHRLTGAVLVAENKLDEGQTSLQQAIHIARAQHAATRFLVRASTHAFRRRQDKTRHRPAPKVSIFDRRVFTPALSWRTTTTDPRLLDPLCIGPAIPDHPCWDDQVAIPSRPLQ
jgi:predicted ATPase